MSINALRCGVSLALLCFSIVAWSSEQSFESCSLTAWESVGSINDFVLGVPLEKARQRASIPENVEAAYKIAKEAGVEHAYIGALIHYKKCAGSVRQQKPQTQPETKYRNCAYQSATRANILVYIDKGITEASVKAKLPAQLHELIGMLYSVAQDESLTKAASMSANAMKSCVEAAN